MQPVSGNLKQGARPLILFGGGLDSCALVEFYYDMQPTLLYFNYGQKATIGEQRALRHYSAKYSLKAHMIEVPRILIPDSPLTTDPVVTDAKDHAQNYLPGRNLLFSAMAYSFACSWNLAPIILGASPAPPEGAFHDAKQGFASQFNMLVDYAYPDGSSWLILPLVAGNREDYVRRALSRDPELFKWSFTCYESTTTEECGVCVHCQQKRALATKLDADY